MFKDFLSLTSLLRKTINERSCCVASWDDACRWSFRRRCTTNRTRVEYCHSLKTRVMTLIEETWLVLLLSLASNLRHIVSLRIVNIKCQASNDISSSRDLAYLYQTIVASLISQDAYIFVVSQSRATRRILYFCNTSVFLQQHFCNMSVINCQRRDLRHVSFFKSYYYDMSSRVGDISNIFKHECFSLVYTNATRDNKSFLTHIVYLLSLLYVKIILFYLFIAVWDFFAYLFMLCWRFSCYYFLDNNITYLETYRTLAIATRRLRMLQSSDETYFFLYLFTWYERFVNVSFIVFSLTIISYT